jgi:membrane-associated phospholipid phosphatase
MEKIIIALTLMAATAHAKDWRESPVQPIDNEIRGALKWENTQLADDLSDYIMWGMVLAPTAVAWDQSEDRTKHLLGVWAAQGISAGITGIAKISADRTRPNKSDTKSFFSGHTSAAFAGAAATCSMENHYCGPGFALAALVGYLRIAADKHFFSDVMVGAAVGATSGHYIPTLILTF